jgi:molecular chaperone Hsp33
VTEAFGPYPGAPRGTKPLKNDGKPKDDAPIDPLTDRDDLIAAFQIEGEAVRGRIARLGPTIDEILGGHDYPPVVAGLLGEAVLVAALVGDSLKIDGKLIVQARGDGPVRLLVADYSTGGGLRAFAQFDAARVRQAELDARRPTPRLLLGDAALIMTIDQGPDFERYQSFVPLDRATLAEAAEGYFERSEQVPTKLKLAVARTAEGPWRAGGALLQQIAPDASRGDTAEAWERSCILFETLTPEEMLASDLSLARVLYRLFHEDGVRIFPPTALERRCGCSRERIVKVLASFPRDEVAAMIEADGKVRVTCEYCNQSYRLTLGDVDAVRDGGAEG